MDSWQLQLFFPVKVDEIQKSLLVFHEGSGFTYCLPEDIAALFSLFLNNPEQKFSFQEIQQLFPALDARTVLQDLSSKHLIRLS